MKYAAHFLFAIILTATSFPCKAQDINAERMNRDINIARNILQEMFKTSTNSGSIHGSVGAFSFGSHTDISGTYLEDYGVIFTIPERTSMFMFRSEDDGEASAFTFQYGEGEDAKVSEKTITSRIKDFLRDYGSTIGQLPNNERITVIYGSERSNYMPGIRVLSTSGKQVDKESNLPRSISVTAKKSDLEAFRTGSISQAQFDGRLNISVNEEESGRQDLKIMANILETSFEDAGSNAFHISGSVNSSYIENLGALFYLNTGYGSSIFELNTSIVKIREELKSMNRGDSAIEWTSKSPTPDRKSSEFEKDRAAAYQIFLRQLKETLVNYGRTLKSVQTSEQVYVSVSFNRSGDSVPERVDLHIRKSVLESIDRGDISREQALRQIAVQEY